MPLVVIPDDYQQATKRIQTLYQNPANAFVTESTRWIPVPIIAYY
ncbi:hypothetical protein [Xenorhabdus nematophila]|nr:protein of unknown function [Xenorhabdus nematophila AN6/1]